MIAIRQRNDNAFVQAHDQRYAGCDLRVIEAGFKGAGVGEDVFRSGGLNLGHEEFAAGPFHGRRTGNW